MSRPLIILAPTTPVRPDVTGWTIGIFGASMAFGGPAALVWLARLNGWL